MLYPAITVNSFDFEDKEENGYSIRQFNSGETPILVVSSIAAKDLDIAPDAPVSHVINYNLPGNIEEYVQRINLTGRQGRVGLSTSFYNKKDENLAKDLKKLLTECDQDVPAWLEEECQQPRNCGV